MQKLIIKGKRYLNGKILISGSKNASLPILAACILSNNIKLQKKHLHNSKKSFEFNFSCELFNKNILKEINSLLK